MPPVELNSGTTDYLPAQDFADWLDSGATDSGRYELGGDLFKPDLSRSLISFDSERPFTDDSSLFTLRSDDPFGSGHLFEPAGSPLGPSSDTGRGLDWLLDSAPQVATSAQPDAASGRPFGLDGGLSMGSLVLPTGFGLGSIFLNDETDLGVVGFGRARAGLSIPGLSVYDDDIPTRARLGLFKQFNIDGSTFHAFNLGDAFQDGENTVGWGLGGLFLPRDSNIGVPSEGILRLAASTTRPMGGHRLRIEATDQYFSDTEENVFQGGLKLLENVDDAALELGAYGVATSVGDDEHAVRIEGLLRDPTAFGSDAWSVFAVGEAYLGTDRERVQGLADIDWKLPPVNTYLRLTGLAERVPTGESAVLGGEVGTQFPVTKDPFELSAGVFANGQYNLRSGQVDANFGVGAQFGVRIDPNTDLQLRLDPFSGATFRLSYGF